MAAPGDLVLVAISAGPDSTALLHALAQLRPILGLRLRAAHVHHGIRGREADLDARAAAALARKLKVPFSLRKVDARAYARDHKLSLETAARELRYAALEAVASRCRADRIATGHTLDDQAETVLLNLTRGAGPRGLAGIPPIRGRIIRPLLDLSRAEVERYLKAEGLRYRSDPSNADVAHTRNRIRHQLMPALRRLQPAITSHLSRLATIMRAEDEFMSEQAEAAFASVASCRSNKRQVAIRLDAFTALPPALQRRVIRQAIANIKGDELDLDLERVEAVMHLARAGRTGAVVELPGGICAQRGYEELVIRRASDNESEAVSNLEPRISNTQEWLLPIPGELCIPELDLRIAARPSRSKTVPTDPARALMDAEIVPGPLLIRARRPGDRFQPIGAKGTMKLQDFLVNAKVPRAERDRVPVVLSGGRIVWLVGHRISNDAKVTAGTRRTVRLEARNLS